MTLQPVKTLNLLKCDPVFSSPISDTAAELPGLSPPSIDNSEVSIARNSLNLVIKDFEESKYNRDLCSKGLDITRKSKQVLDEIDELNKKFHSCQQQNGVYSDPMSPGNSTTPENSTPTTPKDYITTPNIDVNGKNQKDNTIPQSKDSRPNPKPLAIQSSITQCPIVASPTVKSPIKSPTSPGVFEGFLENSKEFQGFVDCLWNITVFFGYSVTINVESLGVRDKLVKLIEELNTVIVDLYDAIENWKSKRSGWNKNIKTKIIAFAKMSTIMKNHSLSDVDFKVEDCKIPVERLKLANTDSFAIQKHTFSEFNATEDKPVFRGSRNHIRQYWYLGIKRVAEKNLGKFDENDKKFVELIKEIDFMKKLKEQGSNVHILEFLGYCQRSGNFSVVCEWGDYNLQTYLTQHIDLVWSEKLNIACGIADALEYCHEKEILHYDIRTENVLLDQNLQPKLYNFRIKKDPPVMLISADAPIDDARYSSPERLRGEIYNKASEVYSFAMVMWEIQHHQKPYAELTPDQITAKILACEYPEPGPVTGTPEEFQCLMERAWSLSSDERPDMQLLHDKLEKLDFAFLSCHQVKLIGVEENIDDMMCLDNISIIENEGFGEGYNPLVKKAPEIEQGIRYHDEGKYKKAWETFREYGSLSHDPEVIFWIGFYYLKGYYEGKNGKPNVKEGIYYLNSAAKMDHTESQVWYAVTMLNTPWAAKEHEKDRYKLSIDYLRKAARLNHPKALRCLGGIIMKGQFNQKRDIFMGKAMIKKSTEILEMIQAEKNAT